MSHSFYILQNGSEKIKADGILLNSQDDSFNITSSPGQNIDFQMNLWQKGIDFYARGNEPSWSLDMDFEKGFYFKTLDGIEINTPPLEGKKAMDSNVLRFYFETETGALIIAISEEECNDTMSDEVFPNKVKIEAKSSTENEYKILEGCGRYVADYSLHDIWVLTHLNGKDLQSGSKEKRLPMFEFYARDGKVLGNTGCNDFNGTYYISGFKEIQFRDMAITKISCSHMQIENLLAKSVFGKRMKYSKENLKLKLTGFDGTELIFKKID
jgi:heat shock protein HslJ